MHEILLSRGLGYITAVADFSQRVNQQTPQPPSTVAHPTAKPRGRSRDVSPVAVAGKASEQVIRAHISVSVVKQSKPRKDLLSCDAYTALPCTRSFPTTMHHQSNLCLATTGPLVASPTSLPLSTSTSPLLVSPSPLDPVMPRTQSSTTITSQSSEPTPLGPLTPPEGVSMPLDYYERPPSPPRTLKDQMQVAYALDDMHLAKVLYLKLQGIEVTGDDDPRIDEVQDEDFATSFVPSGCLVLDEEDERRCREAERREMERLRVLRREERLRALERLWEESARQHREARLKIARKKDEQARQRRREEREAREREREREAREREEQIQRYTRPIRAYSLTQRPLLDYSTIPTDRTPKRRAPTPSDEDDSQYSLMPYFIPRHSSLSHRSPASDKDNLTLSRFQRELALEAEQSCSSRVRFAEVIKCLNGPLFPCDSRSDLQAQRKLRRFQRELFDILVEPVEYRDGERMGTGKQQEDIRPRRTGLPRVGTTPACAACSLSSESASGSTGTSGASSSASAIVRRNSWFSFGGHSSRSSISTTVTTPSSSLASSKSPTSSPSLVPSIFGAEQEIIPHTCRGSRLTPVPARDHPLSIAPTTSIRQRAVASPGVTRGRSLVRSQSVHEAPNERAEAADSSRLVHRVGRSVSTLMDMAAQFQKAYVKATLFSVGLDLPRSESRSISGSRSPPRTSRRVSTHPSERNGKLRPEGYRALSFDVNTFLLTDDELCDQPQSRRTLIPLAAREPNTVVQHHRVFPVLAQPPRSPFRLAQPPPGPRLRPVANPVLLRLQALQNVCADRALPWEGRAREGRMSAGKEKLLGIAWEGIGRSGLGWEVRDVVC
ncbi:uncharacterized protein LAESUDRAFT_811225 [Laetiporus sulphureus 93-53]|uniref:Uncharacterized protein n=1 Tax=Laetiporus sulphureus 93-53 TaxID=1314785 RepID=A0A165F8X2_9APHY|nr:uncharacterized protein LAESUDRAFT_811225 [Laetiporus sulphureus 93-53]KZT08611.1 hypothetical protein LAESUDRAFT_811225 [Laetiporus sulphureus 93-53]